MSNDLVSPEVAGALVDVDTSRVGGVTFATFASMKSAHFAEWAAAIPGLRDGDAILVHPAPRVPVRLDPFKAHLVAARQLWVHAEDDGTVVSVLTENPNDYTDPHKESVETVLLLYVGDRLVPARMSFRTTKCPAANLMAKTLKFCQSPEWASESPAHRESLKAPYPFLRFTATIRTQAQTARSSGRKFLKAVAGIAPITPAEMNIVAAAVKCPDFRTDLATSLDALQRRVEQLEELAQ